jgi:16S rRNA (guanine527-N7)-methyltransferase
MIEEREKEYSWKDFAQRYELSDHQTEQFQWYAQALVEWNAKFNITALTTVPEIVLYHFADSLEIMFAPLFAGISSLADVGSGGGFPGLALKIKFPHVQMVLIEVNKKKCSFLEAVVDKLGLDNVVVSAYDWRTFLRHTHFDIDMVCARASLRPEELVRMFAPVSPYNTSLLAYWASETWEPARAVHKFFAGCYSYDIAMKRRKIAFFRNFS